MWIDPDLQQVNKLDNCLLDISALEEKLCEHNWNKPQLQRPGPLSGTKAIYYQHFSSDPNLLKETYDYAYDADDIALRDMTLPILDQVQQLYPHWRFIKGEISVCPGEEEQKLHRDPRVFHRFSHRIHIPLITNLGAWLEVDNKTWHLEKHNIYFFNNIKYHRSFNKGQSIRVHMIVDIMPNNWWHTLTMFRPEADIYDWAIDLVVQSPIRLMERIAQEASSNEKIVDLMSRLLGQIADKTKEKA